MEVPFRTWLEVLGMSYMISCCLLCRLDITDLPTYLLVNNEATGFQSGMESWRPSRTGDLGDPGRDPL